MHANIIHDAKYGNTGCGVLRSGMHSPVHLDLENDLIQSLYFFSKVQKKLQVLADPVVVNFFEMHLIQHL